MGSLQLVRHGQASWGADDYDQLSALGARQAAALGDSWEAAGQRPDWSVCGSMKRHAQTAVPALDAVDGDLYDVDAGWDEYDHLGLTGVVSAADRPDDPREFQALLDARLVDWVAGSIDGPEPFAAFTRRVMTAFEQSIAEAGPGRSAVAFTSGGPIALVASHLLTGGPDLFVTLNRVVLNASVTTIIAGRGGHRLLTFNEHTHIPTDWQTFR